MKKLTKVLSLMLVAALVLGTFAVPASAATKKKTVKKQGFTTETKTVEKKAATVKKGTTKLTIKSGCGFIKFKAPKTKKYKFTFSQVKDKDNYGGSAFVGMLKKSKYSSSSITYTDVSTKGGKYNTLWLSVNGGKYNDENVKTRPIATRSGSLKLKKGEMFYMYFYNGSNKTTCKLVIK